MSKSKTSQFFLVGLLSAAVGAIAGVLFAPQSGEKTREEIAKMANKIYKELKSKASDQEKAVKEVFGEVTEAAEKKYIEVKKAMTSKVAALKTAGMSVDKDKYLAVVDEVVDEFKGDLGATKDGLLKMKKLLVRDWEKIKKALS